MSSRYRTAVALSAGGTAEIYKAYDPVLQRYVALKFLHRDDPLLVQRMFREARAQARLKHEGICQVYEVGELDGRPYIAMQYIDGEELGSAAPKMTLEEKVQVMWRVAQAVHAAHREGLIHRDLKPANMMVQHSDDGQLRPVVVDFGLVWEHANDSMTQVGQVLGTPPYMAPEQVEGEREKLDRRTDVYGLGATLYDLLAGRPPFVGERSVELMMKTIREDPTPLRKLDSSIPADLETIVLKCLEKEPHRRYDSAAALAEDLRRFLDSEPIAARPASLSYRLSKSVRKHRAIVAVSTLTVFLLLLSLAMVWRTRWRAEERIGYEQRFAQVGRDVGWTMRAVYMSSLHDITDSKRQILERIEAIEEELGSLGDLGAGPAHYAIGRCYLVLLEDEKARSHLEQAWELGYRAPEAAYALGLALGRQYQDQLKRARNVRLESLREKRIQTIEANYRNSAISYLRVGRESDAVAVEYVEALIALYEKRFDDALEKARAARTRLPWLYESQILEADILTQRGDEERRAGDVEGTRTTYRQAAPIYRQAIASAGSDPRAYIGLCELTISRMLLKTHQGQTEDVASDLEQALEACSQATLIDPSLGEPNTLLARAYQIQARAQTWSNEDPTPALAAARERARHGIELDPERFEAHMALGTVNLQEAEFRMMGRLGDPRPLCEQAAESYRRALEIRPGDPIGLNTLGSTYAVAAQFESRNGIDPSESLVRAAAVLQSAIEVRPDSYDLHHNLANVYGLERAQAFDRGEDFGPAADRHAQHRARALEIKPESDWAHAGMANAYFGQAAHAFYTGGDPELDIRRALEFVDLALELNPRNTEFHNRQVGYRLTRAYYQLMAGQSPSEVLAEAQGALARFQEVAPDRYEIFGWRIAATTLALRWSLTEGGKKPAGLAEAIDSIDVLGELTRDDFFYQTSADFLQWFAAWQLATGRDPTEALARGLAITEEGLGADPRSAVLRGTRGVLYLLQGRNTPDPSERRELWQQAEADLQAALRSNRWLAAEIDPWLQDVERALGPRVEVREPVD